MGDVGYATRTLLRRPYFSLTIIALLSIGISGIISIFSLLDAMLLRPLPVRRPSELIRFVQRVPRLGALSQFHSSFYRVLHDHSSTVTAVFGEMFIEAVIDEPAPAQQVLVGLSTPGFFDAIGVMALRGRTLLPYDEADTSETPPIVLSYDFWLRRFAADPEAVGRTLVLKGHRFNIVGVMPRTFNGVSVERTPDVRVPIRTFALLEDVPKGANLDEYELLELGARLKGGVGIQGAESECLELWKADLAQYASRPRGPWDEIRFPMQIEPLTRGVSILRDRYANALKFLLGFAVLLLMMVCANVAGLMSIRNTQRRDELMIRFALGCAPSRLVALLSLESTYLTVMGVAGAVLTVLGTSRILLSFFPPIWDAAGRRLTLSLDLGMNLRVLLFALVVALFLVVVSGVAPAIAAVSQLAKIVRSMSDPRAVRVRRILVIVQIVICTVTLIGANLLVETFRQLKGADLGFDRTRIATFTAEPSLVGYTNLQEELLESSLLQQVRAIPGVVAAGLASRPVLRDRGLKATVALPGQRPSQSDASNVNVNIVSPQYFDAMGMHILMGRDFADGERSIGSLQSAIVNESFARHFFGNVKAVGQQFGFSPTGQVAVATFEVIGVVNDAKYRGLREDVMPTLYEVSSRFAFFTLYVRTHQDPIVIIQPVRRVLAHLDQSLPFLEVHTIAEEISLNAAAESLTAQLASILALLSMFLTIISVYGLISFEVTSRTHELGVRMALGAQHGNIVALLARHAAGTTGMGVLIGVVLAILSAHTLQSLLYGIAPLDISSYLLAIVLVVLTVALGTSIALARIIHIRPTDALRVRG